MCISIMSSSRGFACDGCNDCLKALLPCQSKASVIFSALATCIKCGIVMLSATSKSRLKNGRDFVEFTQPAIPLSERKVFFVCKGFFWGFIESFSAHPHQFSRPLNFNNALIASLKIFLQLSFYVSSWLIFMPHLIHSKQFNFPSESTLCV